MLTAFAAMQELLKKLFESNGGSKGSKLAIFLVHIWWIPGAHLMECWCSSDRFLVHFWRISGDYLMDFWRRSRRVPLVSLRLGRAGGMGLLDGKRLWGAHTPAQGMDVPAKLLESVCSTNSQNPLDNIHFKRCTDLSFAWSGVMRWGLFSTLITKAKRIQWNFTYWKDWPWSQTPPTQTCSIGGVLCPAGPKSTSPSSKSIHVKVFLARVTP